jgi:hypothetical protein
VTAPAKRLATRLQGEQRLIAAVHKGDAEVRAEPFDAIVLDLRILWADVVLPEASR